MPPCALAAAVRIIVVRAEIQRIHLGRSGTREVEQERSQPLISRSQVLPNWALLVIAPYCTRSFLFCRGKGFSNVCSREHSNEQCLLSQAVWGCSARRGRHGERPAFWEDTRSILSLCRAVMDGGEGDFSRKVFQKTTTCHVHSSLAVEQITDQQNTSRRS